MQCARLFFTSVKKKKKKTFREVWKDNCLATDNDLYLYINCISPGKTRTPRQRQSCSSLPPNTCNARQKLNWLVSDIFIIQEHKNKQPSCQFQVRFWMNDEKQKLAQWCHRQFSPATDNISWLTKSFVMRAGMLPMASKTPNAPSLHSGMCATKRTKRKWKKGTLTHDMSNVRRGKKPQASKVLPRPNTEPPVLVFFAHTRIPLGIWLANSDDTTARSDQLKSHATTKQT